MPAPDSLTVAALKTRLDKKLAADDPLLQELLDAAFDAAQAPAPLGSGRVLAPDPVPVFDPEAETPVDESDPVERTILTRGRRVVIPDARELTRVMVDGTEVLPLAPESPVEDEGGEREPVANGYTVVRQNGLIVQLSLSPEHARSWARYEGIGRRMPAQPHVVTVTGRFGFVTLPDDMANAIYQLAARAFYEREAQYADTTATVEGTPVQQYFRQLPPRVKLAFAAYTVPVAVGGLS